MAFSGLPGRCDYEASVDEMEAVLDGNPDRSSSLEHEELNAQPQVSLKGRRVILVGQSYGVLLNHEFLKRHPDRVVGVVALDPIVRSDAMRAVENVPVSWKNCRSSWLLEATL